MIWAQKAIGAYGAEDAGIWVKCLKYTQKQGKATGPVVWRATKELGDAEEFLNTVHARDFASPA